MIQYIIQLISNLFKKIYQTTSNLVINSITFVDQTSDATLESDKITLKTFTCDNEDITLEFTENFNYGNLY